MNENSIYWMLVGMWQGCLQDQDGVCVDLLRILEGRDERLVGDSDKITRAAARVEGLTIEAIRARIGGQS